MSTPQLIGHIQAHFTRIYLGGIPSLLNDDGAFLSFICTSTAIEALGGFLRPDKNNGPRFKGFIQDYFPADYHTLADALWKFRNAAVHGFSPGPFSLTHHNGHLHLTKTKGSTILNAEDFYSDLVAASRRYFSQLKSDPQLQALFIKRSQDQDTGILTVGPLT